VQRYYSLVTGKATSYGNKHFTVHGSPTYALILTVCSCSQTTL
jgi:hypothetical protein